MATTRTARSYRAFVHELLQLDTPQGNVFDGVLCLGARGGVEFALGSFELLDATSSSRHCVRVDLHDNSASALLDTREITRVFDQVTRRAILQQNSCSIDDTQIAAAAASSINARAAAPLPPAIHVGDEAFQVVFASFTTVCAVARGRSHGLVAEKLPFGMLVVLFRAPHELAHVASLVGRSCASLRR